MKIRVYVKTGVVGSGVADILDVDDAEWEDMSVMEKDAYVFEWVHEHIKWGYEELGV